MRGSPTGSLSYLEGVLEQLGVEAAFGVDGEAHDGESDRSAPAGEGAVLGRRRHQRAALAGIDGIGRRPEQRRRPRLDLDEDELSALPANQVELPAARGKAGADDVVALRPQQLGGGALAGPA